MVPFQEVVAAFVWIGVGGARVRVRVYHELRSIRKEERERRHRSAGRYTRSRGVCRRAHGQETSPMGRMLTLSNSAGVDL